MATGTKMRPATRSRAARTEARFARQSLCVAIALTFHNAYGDSGEGNGQTGVVVIPRISLSQMYTDNLRLADQAEDRALVTTVAPGIAISSRSGLIRGAVDYSINGLIYTKSEQATRVQHALNSQFTAELLSQRAFLDVRATIGQQAVSAFGATSTDPALIDSNRKETATLSISPYVRGEWAGVLGYELRADGSVTRVSDSQLGDSSAQLVSARVGGLGSSRLLNWSGSLVQQRLAPRYGRRTGTDTADLSLSYVPDVDWTLSASGGYQRTDVRSVVATSGATYGAVVVWTPTPRTRVTADAKHQVYGNTYALGFEHRMARVVWRLQDSRSLVVGMVGAGGTQSLYELLYLQYASVEPDPIKRDALVRQYLQSNGLSVGTTVTSGYLTASTSLTRRQEASMAWSGQRSSATATFSRSQSERLGSASAVADDLAVSGQVLQQGFAINLAHRLTPSSSVSVTVSRQRSWGATASQSSDLNSVLGNWSVNLARRSTVQFGLRHSSFDGTARRYRENALFANLVRQF